MKNLNDKELMSVDGGGFNVSVAVGIIAGISFLISVIDGIIRPLKCN